MSSGWVARSYFTTASGVGSIRELWLGHCVVKQVGPRARRSCAPRFVSNETEADTGTEPNRFLIRRFGLSLFLLFVRHLPSVSANPVSLSFLSVPLSTYRVALKRTSDLVKQSVAPAFRPSPNTFQPRASLTSLPPTTSTHSCATQQHVCTHRRQREGHSAWSSHR